MNRLSVSKKPLGQNHSKAEVNIPKNILVTRIHFVVTELDRK